jgi:nucleotidyltransferase/DNA polymerase involved in DNA repair
MTLFAGIQIPHLAIAIERRDDPLLSEAPLILYTSSTHTIVYDAAPETWATAGQPLRQALLRMPQAICRPAIPERDLAAVAGLATLLQTISPRVAVVTATPNVCIDLDLGQRIRLPQARALAERIGSMIRTRLGLLSALGLARTRGVARVAAAIAGAGVAVVIAPGREASFLAPLPISMLPIDDEVAQRLSLLGLRTIGTVAALPIDAIEAQFGAYGQILHRLVNGHDDWPLAPNTSAPRIKLTRRFDGAITSRTVLEIAIRQLVQHLTARLTSGGWAAQEIALTLRFEFGEPWIERRTLAQPTSDGALLGQALVALLARAECAAGVESLTMEAANLRPTVAAQLELFASQQGQKKQLDDTLGQLAGRHHASFVRAALADPAAYLLEQRVRFEPMDRA